jgi:sucrose-6-phosphatase
VLHPSYSIPSGPFVNIGIMTFILATDLDMTLVGDDTALNTLNGHLSELRNQQILKLVYATGRSPILYKSLETKKELLNPDSLIAAAGTEIYDNAGSPIDGWPKVQNWNLHEIERQLSGLPELFKQPDTEQRRFKISYYLESDQGTYDRVREMLQNLDVDVIYSMDKYLDILPRGVNKGSALRYLAELWEIPQTKIITCGDSENDIKLLNVGKAIVVGNADRALKQWATSSVNKNIYPAKANYAAGITEGLTYWQVLS